MTEPTSKLDREALADIAAILRAYLTPPGEPSSADAEATTDTDSAVDDAGDDEVVLDRPVGTRHIPRPSRAPSWSQPRSGSGASSLAYLADMELLQMPGFDLENHLSQLAQSQQSGELAPEGWRNVWWWANIFGVQRELQEQLETRQATAGFPARFEVPAAPDLFGGAGPPASDARRTERAAAVMDACERAIVFSYADPEPQPYPWEYVFVRDFALASLPHEARFEIARWLQEPNADGGGAATIEDDAPDRPSDLDSAVDDSDDDVIILDQAVDVAPSFSSGGLAADSAKSVDLDAMSGTPLPVDAPPVDTSGIVVNDRDKDLTTVDPGEVDASHSAVARLYRDAGATRSRFGSSRVRLGAAAIILAVILGGAFYAFGGGGDSGGSAGATSLDATATIEASAPATEAATDTPTAAPVFELQGVPQLIICGDGTSFSAFEQPDGTLLDAETNELRACPGGGN